MNKKEQEGLVPKLRFPEFKYDKKWAYKYGDKVFKPISNKNHNSDLPILAITQEHGAIPRNKINYDISVTDKSIEGYKVVEKGDFIISLRSFQGGIEYSSYKGICSPAYIILRKKIAINELFFKNYFKYPPFIQALNKDLEGIRDGKMVSYKQFSTILLPVPQLEEQQKIADCLTSIDNLISNQNKQLEALQDHKKGLMQQLFPAEDENIPKLRFPEFLDQSVWKEVRLQQLGQFISGLTYSPDDVRKNGLLVLRSSNVQNGNISLEDKVYVRADIEGVNMSEPGDILICVRNGSKALIGKNALITEGIPASTHGAFMTIFRSKIFKFIFQLFQTIKYEQQVMADLGATINSININNFKKYEFYIPEGLKEQQKIADCLSSLDDLITAQSQKIELLKEHKKGLMQQLFPNMDEVKNE